MLIPITLSDCITQFTNTHLHQSLHVQLLEHDCDYMYGETGWFCMNITRI